MWMTAAVLSAFFSGITAILAKCSIKKTDSDVAVALRTVVVLLFSWLTAFISGSAQAALEIDKKSLLFLTLSGVATGASWLCYFRALSFGDVNKVAVIDKLSTPLTVIIGIIAFGETQNLPAKLIGTALIGVGTVMMTAAKTRSKSSSSISYIYAAFSALFASLTSILAKIGIENVDSNLATAVRTVVVLIMALLIVFAKGKACEIKKTNKREMKFIALSGVATGGAWLCYYYAISKGPVSAVVPIDKLGVLVTIAFSRFALGEKITKKAAAGAALLTAGTLATAVFA